MKTLLCGFAVALALLTGCNQYSTPVIEPSTAQAGAAPNVQAGANARSANPLNSESSPGETTGSIGGTPGGTSSAQTVPSSSDGVR